MTVLLTFVGIIVFVCSLFTVGFTSGFRRLCMFALTGVVIDCLIITIAVATGIAVNLY